MNDTLTFDRCPQVPATFEDAFLAPSFATSAMLRNQSWPDAMPCAQLKARSRVRRWWHCLVAHFAAPFDV